MYKNIKLGKHVLSKSFQNLLIFKKSYSEKFCPIFDGSASSFLTMYQNIFWGGSFGCKKLLNFTCFTMKFNNCHHLLVMIEATDVHLSILYPPSIARPRLPVLASLNITSSKSEKIEYGLRYFVPYDKYMDTSILDDFMKIG